jgi:hypothetical protein
MADYIPPIFQGDNTFLGLVLESKRRKQQEAEMRARQEQQDGSKFAALLRDVAPLGDPKITRAALAHLTGNRYTPEMEDLALGMTKQYRAQQKAAEEKAALPKGAEQKDVASGVAGILAQPGDPRLAALAALRSIPDSYPPELTNRLAMRGGAIAADRGARFDRNVALMERQSAITESRQQRKAAGKSGGDSKKLKPEVESAWETFLDAGVPFEEWRSDPEMPRSVVANAMKHPEYVAMLRARKWKGVPFLRPGQEGSAPPPTAVTGPVTLKSGIKIEPLDE